MKVRVTKRFEDYKENIIREKDNEFIVSKERFEEIESKLPGYVVEIKEEKKSKQIDKE